MRYPALRPPAPAQAAEAAATSSSSSKTKIIICSIICVVVCLVFLCLVAIGLGVGLGLGLKKSSTSLQIVTANCDYGSSTCGCAAVKPTFASTKIVNGHQATAHSWPWVVALYYNNQFFCDGFLAQDYSIVITAAHCLTESGFNINNVRVYAGLNSRASLSEGQVLTASKYMVHPNYVFGSSNNLNDIAVLKLSSTFTKNDNVGLCCLPAGSTQLPNQGDFAVIVGWGETAYGDTSTLSNVLRQAEIQVQGTKSAYCDVTSTSSAQFCAGYETRDSCQGDSGGPLMTVVNNLWTCTGIVSYGYQCGTYSYYTRVSYYRSFIDNAISQL